MHSDSQEQQRCDSAPTGKTMTFLDAEQDHWLQELSSKEFEQTLRGTLSREFKALGAQLRQEAREDLQRFVDDQAACLKRVLEQPAVESGRSRSASVGSLDKNCARSPNIVCPALAVPTPSAETVGDQQTVEPPGCIVELPSVAELPSVMELPAEGCQELAAKEAHRPHNVWKDDPKMTVPQRGINVNPRSTTARAYKRWEEKLRRRQGGSATSHSSSTGVMAKVQQKVKQEKRLSQLMQEAPPDEGRLTLHNLRASARLYLHKAVCSQYFDYAVGTTLLLNAILIGIQADQMAAEAHHTSEVPRFFAACNIIFCIIFAGELMARVAVNGRGFLSCYQEDWKWNWFDAIVVFVAIVDELSQAFLQGTRVQEAISSVGIIRLLRLGRVARLVRMVRLIPELKSMVYLIVASMSSFMWTCLLIVMMIFCFAVYFTELATEMVSKHPHSDMTDVLRCWGGLGQSILSLFQAMTGGDDWRNFVDVFNRSESSFLFNAALFSIYIAFTILVMLNLVTGVFVEGAQRIMREDRQEALMKLASKVFICGDIDCSASLQKEEFDQLLDAPQMEEFLRETGLRKTEADQLFYVFDEDDSGDLSLMEFVGGCIRMNASAKSADVAELRYQQKVNAEKLAARLDSVQEAVSSLAEVMTARPNSSTSNIGWAPNGNHA